MCRNTDWISNKWRRTGLGNSWRYTTFVELSKKDTGHRALPEVSTWKVKIAWKLFANFLNFLTNVFSITCINLPVGSKWLYVGTEKGNIHIVHTDSFSLSGYIIHWNKAVELWVQFSINKLFIIWLFCVYTVAATESNARDVWPIQSKSIIAFSSSYFPLQYLNIDLNFSKQQLLIAVF